MNIQGTKVLVTGGAGFIGSHLVQSLVELGADVTVYDNLSSGFRGNLEALADDICFIQGDVLDVSKLSDAMRGMQIVSHQAAQLEITKSMDDPIEDLRLNTIGTLNVLDAAVRNGVSKIIHASSACVYGQAQHTPQSEDHPTNPNWAYGVSKLASEKYCQTYSHMYEIPVVSLRYSIVYGPCEWYGRVLTIFLKRLSQGMPPVVFGKGEQQRDFIYVEDVVRLHNRCILEDSLEHEVFNVSTGIGTSIVQLARMVCEMSDEGLEPVYEDIEPAEKSSFVEQNRMRLPAELQQMVLDNSKARRVLGWEPQVELQAGLALEYEWLISHRNLDLWQTLSY